MEKENTQNLPEKIQPVCPHCLTTINSRFTLSVVAIIVSCFTGLWTIPLALAALILSLRTQDFIQENRTEEARRTAWWAGFFGWLTIVFALLPILLLIFFGGAMVAFFTALLAAA